MALCPQLQEHNDSIANELGLSFPVLQDFGNQLATEFGLTQNTPPDVVEAEQFLGLDLPSQNGVDSWDLPIPARFVIDADRTVRYVTLHLDHRTRTHPKECLDLIAGIHSNAK